MQPVDARDEIVFRRSPPFPNRSGFQREVPILLRLRVEHVDQIDAVKRHLIGSIMFVEIAGRLNENFSRPAAAVQPSHGLVVLHPLPEKLQRI